MRGCANPKCALPIDRGVVCRGCWELLPIKDRKWIAEGLKKPGGWTEAAEKYLAGLFAVRGESPTPAIPLASLLPVMVRLTMPLEAGYVAKLEERTGLAGRVLLERLVGLVIEGPRHLGTFEAAIASAKPGKKALVNSFIEHCAKGHDKPNAPGYSAKRERAALASVAAMGLFRYLAAEAGR